MLNISGMFAEIDRILLAEKGIIFRYAMDISMGCSLRLNFERASYEHPMPWPNFEISLPPAIHPDVSLALSIELVKWVADPMMVAHTIQEFTTPLKTAQISARFSMSNEDRQFIRRQVAENQYDHGDCELLKLSFHVDLPGYNWLGQISIFDFEYFFTAEELTRIETAAT